MLYLTVMLTLVGLAACVLDHKLEAKYQTMPHSEFIDYFNDQNYSWVMTQYPENIIINFNLQLNMKSDHELPTKIHDPEVIGDLPENFDARLKWPHCKTIKEIYYQQNCDSCWAHGVANTASDRICIKHGTEIRLSEQDLECSHPHQTICHSGSPASGFLFWKNIGLVPRDCKPYDPLDVNRNKCVRFCQYDPILGNYLQKKFFAEEVYSVRNDSYQIKAELVINGPVQAGMPVYSDFRSGYFGYKGGIYEHKHGELLGYHSVRVIGYGVENGVEYWLVANSWGACWGEKGLFRIKAFQEDMHFEEYILAGIPR